MLGKPARRGGCMLLRRLREGGNSFCLVGVAANKKRASARAEALTIGRLERSGLGCFGISIRNTGFGSSYLRVRFTAVELTHDVGAN